MFSHSTTKISNEQVNRVVATILNKRQRTLREQQQTFLRRNTDENNKRNNYLVEKFTMKKRQNSSKENLPAPAPLPTKKTSLPIFLDDDDDDDFISSRKRPKLIKIPPVNPIKECLDTIIRQIEEEDDARCPICNEILSNLFTLDQRQEHVNRCLEISQIESIETKQQKSLLSYGKFSASTSSSTRKATTSIVSSQFKCQICGASFNVKRTYLAHLKKCSAQNSVQLKHVINFAAKSVPTTTSEIPDETKLTIVAKTKPTVTIKNRIIKMEVPRTEDDEQQQLAIALSASLKTAVEPPNAFEILQMASKKSKTIDLLTSPLWNVSMEEKLRLMSRRLSNLCERLMSVDMSSEAYQFPPSALLHQSQSEFGFVDWWKITTTDPQEDEIPMTQLVRIMEDEESISN